MKYLKVYLIIFLTAFSAIVIEILFTRLFSAIYFSSFTFFIISTAMLGTGLSGLQFALSKKRKISPENFLFILAISLPVILFMVVNIKIDFLNIFGSIKNIIFLLINFSALMSPFFLSGAVLVRFFSENSSNIGKFYFIDLAGAALGSIVIIPLISYLGVIKFFFLISIFLLIILLIINIRESKKLIILFGILVFFSLLFFQYEKFFIITPKVQKRDFVTDQKRGTIEYSSWSPINKIDIAPFAFNRNRKVIWLNCGTQQSWLVKEDPYIRTTKPIQWTQASIPYQLTDKKDAFIIGSAGGYEVYCAISNGFKRIIAVEMDPKLCDLVKRKYSNYIGDIFHKKGVYLINDEGRSRLSRLNKKFDVIQMVNSHPKDTMLSGGLSISETYIYTTEAFRQYWTHLKKKGFLSIVHIYGERMFATALTSLREMNIKEPENKFFIIQDKKGFNFFFMKKGDINPKDIKILTKFAGKRDIVFSPNIKVNNIYYKLAYGDFSYTVKNSSVNINPVKDNSPYFNQPNLIGQFRFKNNLIKGIARKKVYRVLKYTNYVYISILLTASFFSFFFIYLPLKRTGQRARKNIILYFFLIGSGFISIEIVLIKIFQLLLGNPAYSISIIIFSILLSSGIGSFYSQKILKFFNNRLLSVALIISIILTLYSITLFPLIYLLMTIPLFFKIIISTFLIFIIGIPLGVFFPSGIKKIEEHDKVTIGWAWGANGFATVLGSVITVILSINFNFSLIFIASAIIYLFAGFLHQRS